MKSWKVLKSLERVINSQRGLEHERYKVLRTSGEILHEHKKF